MRIPAVNFITKSIEKNRINKQQIEEMARDLADCHPGYIYGHQGKVERRAVQILKEQEIAKTKLLKEQEKIEDAKMPWNYPGPYTF